jgi:hypothetical protein
MSSKYEVADHALPVIRGDDSSIKKNVGLPMWQQQFIACVLMLGTTTRQ